MKKTWLGLLMPVLFCACSEQNVGNEYFLRGQEVKYDSANGDLWPEYMSGDVIVARSPDMNHYIGKIAKDEWQNPEKLNMEEADGLFFSQGNSGELLILNHASREKESGNLLSLTKVPDADIRNRTKWEKYDLKQVPDIIYLSSSYAAMSDTTILVSGLVRDDIKHLFSIIDFKNQSVKHLDYWPENSVLSDMDIWYCYCLNSSILENGKGRFLYKNGSAKDAFIFSIEGTHVNVLDTLYSYSYTPGKFTIERLSCCANSDRIYMLTLDSNNKGEKLKESDTQEPHLYISGNTVEVYDWDGVKQEVIHLDNYAHRIMLSGDGKTLYLFAQTDEIIKPAIFSYDISNLKDNPMIDSVEIEEICKANLKKTLKKYGKKDFLKEGDRMADFELYDYDDKPHHLNEFLGKGKYTILEFSQYGCGPCHAARPHFEKFYKQNKDKVEMITISEDKVSEWKKKPLGEVSWHEWNDHNLAIDIKKKYDVHGTPTFFIINPEGKIIKKLVGFNEGRIDEINDIISGKK